MSKGTTEMPIIEHLEELRRVLIVSILATLVLAVVAYFFSDQIMAVLVQPATRLGVQIIFTGVTEAFFVKIKVSLFAGFIAALPVILWQVWSFIIPALRRNERLYFSFFVLISFLFFVGGVLFGFYGVYNLGISFLLRFGGANLVPMLSIDKYISFTVGFLLPFGFVFELPLVSFILAKLHVITYGFLSKTRRYALLIIVAVSAIITPTPDMITCLIVSGPLYLLYEASVWVVRTTEWLEARKQRRQKLEEPGDA